MDIKPIRTKANYRDALKQIEKLMNAKADTAEGEKLDVLVTLVEAYERKHYPLDLPDPLKPSNSKWTDGASPSKIWSPSSASRIACTKS